MIDRRTKNAEIFRDTERRYTSEPTLMQAIQQSTNSQVFIAESENVIVPSAYKTETAKVIVSGKRSLEAAEAYAKQGMKVCVLNFASATTPGGGVVNGSSAQEECICRCTTLYPCLNTDAMWNAFVRRRTRYTTMTAFILRMYACSKATLTFPRLCRKTNGGMSIFLPARHRTCVNARAML